MEQVFAERLRQLAADTAKIPQEQFDMNQYMNSCETVGCMLGHAFLKHGKYSLKMTCFENHEKFSHDYYGMIFDSPEWKWLFSGYWKDVDNTPTGSAARILYFLENGLPENWEQVLTGDDPLPY